LHLLAPVAGDAGDGGRHQGHRLHVLVAARQLRVDRRVRGEVRTRRGQLQDAGAHRASERAVAGRCDPEALAGSRVVRRGRFVALCALLLAVAPRPGRAEESLLEWMSTVPLDGTVALVDSLVLDRGPIHLRFGAGQLAYLAPYHAHLWGCVFLGPAILRCKPPLAIEQEELRRSIG